MAGAAPVIHTIEGKEPGPSVRVSIGRTERAKAIGIDKQLAGFQLKKGKLVIETHVGEVPAATDGPTADWNIQLRWSDKPPGLGFSKSGVPLSQLPAVASSAPEKASRWFRDAVKNSVTPKSLAAHAVTAVSSINRGETICLHFATPQTGAPRSRQIRFSRRFVAELLVSENMMDPIKGPIPPALDVSKLICLYDAGGSGFGGSMSLERIIAETNLDFLVMPVCGEDIREGVLDRAKGFIIPGGGARAIAVAMKPDGVDRVKDFVEKGGAYIGVCAGAYFSTSGFKEYSGMSHLEHSAPWMKGRALLKVELTPEGIDLLGSEFKSFTTRYNNGPVFPDIGPPPEGSPQQPVTALAVFKQASVDNRGKSHDSMIDTPAILATQWGRGRVLTISPHPESHKELTLMVARCYGWALRIPKDQIELLK